MKIKLPLIKKKTAIKEEEGPQKAFEEFDIEQDVLNELDALPEEITEEENVEDESNIKTEEENNKIEIISESNQQLVDASSNEFINMVRDNINICAKEIREVSDTMEKIESQKNSESFWKKGENIKIISKNINKMSEVQQKTLDLLVMFLGASGKMADDYDTILKTIDELGEVNGGEVEVLDYLLKIKKMVKEIKNNDQRLKDIVYDNEQLKLRVEELEKNYSEKVSLYEKATKITSSKIQRLHLRLNRHSFFILLSYILIIAIGVILYLKVFK